MKLPAVHPPFLHATFILLAILCLILTGCWADTRAERKKNSEVILNCGGAARTLDPGLVTDTVSSRGCMAFMRGLMMLDSTGKAQPELAEKMTVSDDGTVYDFILRPSKWTNGKPVTSDDFAYAWFRVLTPEFAAEYSYMLFYIAGAKEFFEQKGDRAKVGIEILAPDHLRVRLTVPAPFFPQLLAHQIYYPVCRSVDEANPKWALRAETYVGSGPFRMVEYNPGDKLVGARNEGYWNAANVAMNTLTFRFIEEETTERISFDNREIDGTYQVPRPDLEYLKRGESLKIAPQIGTYFLNFNMQLPIFADIRVRKALTLAINRQSIVKNVTRAGERPAFGLVPPELYATEPKAYFKDAQFDEARRLLAEAGYPDGKGFPTLRYIYNTTEEHRTVAQVIQESWRKELGVNMIAENQEFKVLIDNRRQGKFDLARNAWIADFGDPINFLEIFITQSGNNDSHFFDPHYDELIERARTEAVPQKRLAILHEAEDYFMEKLPIIPIRHYQHPYLSAPDLEGYDLSPMMTIDVAKLRWKS